MKAFTQLFDELDSTTSTNEKIAALKKYFTKANPSDSMWALLILTSRLSKRIITSKTLKDIFLTSTNYPDWLLEESYSHVGDTAETISLLLQSLDITQKNEPTSDISLTQWLEVEIPKLGAIKDKTEQGDKLMQYWKDLSPAEVFILNKLMTGGFRVGVSEKLVIRGLSEVYGVATDQLTHRMTGLTGFDPDFFARLISTEATEVTAHQPYPFCLANSWVDRTGDWNADQWDIEWKYDGIRSQIVKREDHLWIWSRGEDEISKSFPELCQAFDHLPNGTVLDGEILVIKNEKIQPFQDLQKRLGRKKVSPAMLNETPAGFVAYDCIESNAEDLRALPLSERRQILESTIQDLQTILGKTPKTEIRLSKSHQVKSLDALENLRDQSREHDAEGLMLKDWNSVYSVGRKTGAWWKHKVQPLTLDAVLLYAQAGTGRRSNLYTDYTFALWAEQEGKKVLVPFAKAYSGLDQKEIDQLDHWIRRHTQEKFGPVRSLEPYHVFEIAFEGIGKSNRHKSGIAVRFPRILRWRKDKKAEDADTLLTAFELLDVPENTVEATP